MTLRKLLIAGAMAVATASPAAAATFNLGDTPDGSYASLNFTQGSLGLTVTGWTYQNNPTGITGLNQFISNPANVYQTAAGVGICSAGENTPTGAAQCPEVDNTDFQIKGPGGGNFNDNELISAAFTSAVQLDQVVLSLVGAGDTLNLWAVAADNNTLVHLGFTGDISGMPSPTGTIVNCVADSCTIDFTPNTAAYSRFLFTSNSNSLGGYRINSITTVDQVVQPGVPEPGTWALMILGFGSAGHMLRRRRLTPVRAS